MLSKLNLKQMNIRMEFRKNYFDRPLHGASSRFDELAPMLMDKFLIYTIQLECYRRNTKHKNYDILYGFVYDNDERKNSTSVSKVQFKVFKDKNVIINEKNLLDNKNDWFTQSQIVTDKNIIKYIKNYRKHDEYNIVDHYR